MGQAKSAFIYKYALPHSVEIVNLLGDNIDTIKKKR
jgi:hypothetical protein